MTDTAVPPVVPTARPRRTPRDRPAPDWEQVHRRNFLERLKRDRPPVDVRAELPDLIARGYEAVPEEDMVRLHWWGLAHDKPKVGTFMVRIKVAGGLVTPAQLRGLGRIARTFAIVCGLSRPRRAERRNARTRPRIRCMKSRRSSTWSSQTSSLCS